MNGEEKDYWLRNRQLIEKQLDDLVAEQKETSPNDPEWDDLEDKIDDLQHDIDEIDGRLNNG